MSRWTMTAGVPRRHLFGRVAWVLSALGPAPLARLLAHDGDSPRVANTRFITSSRISGELRRIGSQQTGILVTGTGEVWHPADLMSAAADEIDRLRDALFWCGGSPSFAEGGEAYEGWQRLCAELLRPDN